MTETIFKKPLAWAVLLSLLWNTAFFFLSLGAVPLEVRERAEEVIQVDLLSEMSPLLSEIRRQIAGKSESGQTTLKFVTGKAAQPMFDQVRIGVSDPEMDRALRLVRQKVGSQWEKSDPPSWGKALLVMEVGLNGQILNVGINRVTGKPGLEQFVFDVVNRAAPFEQAMTGREEPLWIEIEFAVEAVGE